MTTSSQGPHHPARHAPAVARIGTGIAHAAIGVLNATATGTGCSMAVAGSVRATWAARAGTAISFDTSAIDDRLVRAVAHLITPGEGAVVHTSSDLPPSRGLKTSSSAAAALVEAALASQGRTLGADERILLAVQASEDAGVTLTGAFDDQCAVVLGGCHLTDNTRKRRIATLAVPPYAVAIWVPQARISKESVKDVDVSALQERLDVARRLAQEGRVAEALTASGAAYMGAYKSAGLPVDDRPVRVAKASGALGAGLSGTGPAVAALFARRLPLPSVTGGRWVWTSPVSPAMPPQSLEA